MDQLKKYLKSRKNPTDADRQLAKAYENFTQPKTAKELLDYTFTPEYQDYVQKVLETWNQAYREALAAKLKEESGLEDSPEVAAKALVEHRKLYPTWKKEDLHPVFIKMDEDYDY